MTPSKPLLLSILAALAAAGCGGGASSASKPLGAASFTIHWPAASRFIADNANTVVVTVSGGSLATPETRTFTRNDPTTGYDDTQTVGDLAVGSYTVTAKSYHASATESPLTTGSTTVGVTAGAVTPCKVIMQATLSNVQTQLGLDTSPFVPIAGDERVFAPDGTGTATPVGIATGINYRLRITPRAATSALVLFKATAFAITSPSNALTVSNRNLTSDAAIQDCRIVGNVAGTTTNVSITYTDNSGVTATYTLPFTTPAVIP